MRPITAHWLNSLRRHGLMWGIASTLGIGLVAGCSNSARKDGEQSAQNAEESGEDQPHESKSHKPAGGKHGKTMAATTKQPMIGDIPLDVWFNDPLTESKQGGTIAPVKTEDKPKETAATKAAPPPETAAEAPKTAEAGDWASVIPLEDLQEETKALRLNLQKYLASVNVYNGNQQSGTILSDGTVLAAMAAIALVHPEKVSWKDHAAQIRDISVEMTKKAKGLGQKPFEETKKAFEKIDALLSGNPPPGLEEAAADIPFSEVISRRGVMKRLQASSDALRANFQTEATLTKGQDDAAHTATIVAALTKVIGTEGYPDADAPEYQNFAKGLIEANLTMAKAAKDKDFAAFSEANGKVGKFCSECHGAYQSSN